jgi:uncharacterized membrane protein
MDGPRFTSARLLMAAVLGACALALLAGYANKQQCAGPPFNQFGQSEKFGQLKNVDLCYSDIQQLYAFRGIRQHTFPYVDGSLDGDQLIGGAIEYPVLTGLFIWVTGSFADNDAQFLAASALLLAPFGLVTGWLLARLTGRRAFIWAAAPALAAYAFLNWDLLVTCAFVTAVYAWWRGRPALAAALLAVGAALKLYPGFFLAPLLAERLAARDWRGAAQVALAGAGTFLVLNAPFMLAGPDGWWATYEFQRLRKADITTNSIWFWGLPKLTTEQLNTLTPVLIGLAWAVALGVGFWRASRLGSYPWVQVSGSMLCAFLLLNKVHSPQYTLWLLPFFVLIAVRWGWWVAFWAADLLLFVGLFSWYDTIINGGDFGPAKQAVIVGVWGQAVLLALLYVLFLSAPLAIVSSGPSSDSDGSSSSQRRGGASGAPSSTPPAGSSIPDSRTTSYSG